MGSTCRPPGAFLSRVVLSRDTEGVFRLGVRGWEPRTQEREHCNIKIEEDVAWPLPLREEWGEAGRIKGSLHSESSTQDHVRRARRREAARPGSVSLT